MNLDEALETRSWDVGGGIVEVARAVEVVSEAGVDGDCLDCSQGRNSDGLIAAAGDLRQWEQLLQASHVHHSVGDGGVQTEPGQGDGRLAHRPLRGRLDDALLLRPARAERENIEEKFEDFWLEQLFSSWRKLCQVDKDRDELLQDVDTGGGTCWMVEEDVDELGGADNCQGLRAQWREVC